MENQETQPQRRPEVSKLPDANCSEARECRCILEQTWGDGSKSPIEIERLSGSDHVSIMENREAIYIRPEAWPLIKAKVDEYFAQNAKPEDGAATNMKAKQ